MDWKEAAQFVNRLDDSELVQFFYETFATRQISESYNEFVYWKASYVLAEVSRERDFDTDWGPFVVEFIAKHNSEKYSDMKTWKGGIICQSGNCTNCKTSFRSYAKDLICPVCKSEGYGT